MIQKPKDKFMKDLNIIGIDISSKSLDICVKSKETVRYFKIDNQIKQIHKFLVPYLDKQFVVAMENTGRYNWNLYEVLSEFNFEVYVINPLHLVKSLGLVRGKDDKTDAYRIVHFTLKNIDELTQWKPSCLAIKKLKVLLSERNARIKSKRRLIKQQHDYKLMKALGLDKDLTKWNKQQIKQLDDQISKIERLINSLIKEDATLYDQQRIMLSTPGVGKVLAWTMIAKTEGFTRINDPRKMACYSGVVPFEYQSGTSIYRKPRVSLFADKQIKSILHLAAMSAIRLENDFAIYYRRKVEQGKNKMVVLNAVRNKIIHVIFALIKNQTFYQNRLVMS